MHKVASEFFDQMGRQEPMPDFASRYPGKLEGCLHQPFATFSGTVFYRGLLKKAVALFYFCTKDHPFENGNKRFAVTAMLYLLIKNGYMLNISPHILYEIAKEIADWQGSPGEAISMTAKALKPHLVPLSDM